MINSTAYYNDFWNEMRGKQAVTDNLYNNRESKTNAYHLPGESNKKYTAVLQKESAVRQLATVVKVTAVFGHLTVKVRLNGAIWSIWRAWITRTIFRDLKYRHTDCPSLSDLDWSSLLTSPLP